MVIALLGQGVFFETLGEGRHVLVQELFLFVGCEVLVLFHILFQDGAYVAPREHGPCSARRPGFTQQVFGVADSTKVEGLTEARLLKQDVEGDLGKVDRRREGFDPILRACPLLDVLGLLAEIDLFAVAGFDSSLDVVS